MATVLRCNTENKAPSFPSDVRARKGKAIIERTSLFELVSAQAMNKWTMLVLSRSENRHQGIQTNLE